MGDRPRLKLRGLSQERDTHPRGASDVLWIAMVIQWASFTPLLAQGVAPVDAERRVGAALLLWASLAFIAIALVTLGAVWFVVRLGRRLTTEKPRPRIVYHDLSVGDPLPDLDSPESETDEPKA